MLYEALILLQKYDIYHLFVKNHPKKPESILKVLLALFFYKYQNYICAVTFLSQVNE